MDIILVIMLAVVIALAAMIAVGVYLALKARSGAPIELSFRTVLVGYFYLMAFVSFLFLAAGVTSLLKAGMGETFGRSFSYLVPGENMPLETPYGPAGAAQLSPDEIRQREARRVEQQLRNDLVQGGTAVVLGAILWPLHVWGRRRFAAAGDPLDHFLGRFFFVTPLVVYSLVGVATLMLAVFQILSFVLIPARGAAYQDAPGAALATAIVFVPLWAAYILRGARLSRPQADLAPPAAAAA
jgi:hypothetical protein